MITITSKDAEEQIESVTVRITSTYTCTIDHVASTEGQDLQELVKSLISNYVDPTDFPAEYLDKPTYWKVDIYKGSEDSDG